MEGFASLDLVDSTLPWTEPEVFAAHMLDSLGVLSWRAVEAAHQRCLRRVLGLPRLERLRVLCRDSRDRLVIEPVSGRSIWP